VGSTRCLSRDDWQDLESKGGWSKEQGGLVTSLLAGFHYTEPQYIFVDLASFRSCFFFVCVFLCSVPLYPVLSGRRAQVKTERP